MKTFTIDDCAEFLKVDRTTALRLAGEGKLPGAKIGRAWVFLEDELVEYLRGETRKQARERQAVAAVEHELNGVKAERMPMTHVTPKRRGKVLDLTGYPAPA